MENIFYSRCLCPNFLRNTCLHLHGIVSVSVSMLLLSLRRLKSKQANAGDKKKSELAFTHGEHGK